MATKADRLITHSHYHNVDAVHQHGHWHKHDAREREDHTHAHTEANIWPLVGAAVERPERIAVAATAAKRKK